MASCVNDKEGVWLFCLCVGLALLSFQRGSEYTSSHEWNTLFITSFHCWCSSSLRCLSAPSVPLLSVPDSSFGVATLLAWW